MFIKLKVRGFLPGLREMFHRLFLYLVVFANDFLNQLFTDFYLIQGKCSIDCFFIQLDLWMIFKLNVGGFLPDPREMFHG